MPYLSRVRVGAGGPAFAAVVDPHRSPGGVVAEGCCGSVLVREGSMTDPKSTLALCAWLKKRLAEWEAIAKADLAMRPGERLAAEVNGLHLGFVTMVKGSKTAKVVNQTALLAYVKAHHPTEVETIEQIRPAFIKRLCDDVVTKGAFVDADGVVVDGIIDIVYGAPYPKSTLAEDADITVAALLAKGALTVNGLKGIEQ